MDINSYNYGVSNQQTRTSSVSDTPVMDGWFEDSSKNEISVDMFLQLMIAQLTNQDFNDPVDDTQYVTQLAQFATMQQMQELAYYSKSNYVMGLVGKEVSAAKMSLGGNMETVTGVVTKISLIDNQFSIFIGDEMFTLNQIMEVKPAGSADLKPDEEQPDEEQVEPEE
ncbi:MAG: flagellar hook capping FlgD N-terminal domain-containing protein [Erysipelotrichaceae bacterium]